MIKFFSRIRQNLLSEGKTGRYFKYAIGEIVLVVIGILIALQINNWNEGGKEAAFELQTLRSFKESLQTDLSDIDFNIERHQIGLKACDSILRLMESPAQINKDSLGQLFANAFFITRFVYSTSAFESLKSKGVNIISDKLLQKMIVDVYDSRYRFFAVSENDYVDNIWLGLQRTFPSRFEEGLKYDLNAPGFPGSLRPLDFEALKTDQEFLYYLKTHRNWTEIFVNFHYQGLRNDVTRLLELIDEELERRG